MPSWQHNRADPADSRDGALLASLPRSAGHTARRSRNRLQVACWAASRNAPCPSLIGLYSRADGLLALQPHRKVARKGVLERC